MGISPGVSSKRNNRTMASRSSVGAAFTAIPRFASVEIELRRISICPRRFTSFSLSIASDKHKCGASTLASETRHVTGKSSDVTRYSPVV